MLVMRQWETPNGSSRARGLKTQSKELIGVKYFLKVLAGVKMFSLGFGDQWFRVTETVNRLQGPEQTTGCRRRGAQPIVSEPRVSMLHLHEA